MPKNAVFGRKPDIEPVYIYIEETGKKPGTEVRFCNKKAVPGFLFFCR